jgi:hypothetical protein
METTFKLGVAWIFVTYYLVYMQTRFFGYLVVSVGAFLNLMAYMFLNNAQVAGSIAVFGKILFFLGIGITGTLEMHLERERLRVSSWSEIIRGVVPEQLRTRTLEIKDQIVPALLALLLFAMVFYIAGDKAAAASFFVLGAIFCVYYVWKAERKRI